MTKSKHSHRPKHKSSRRNPTAAIVAIAMLAASAFPSPLRAEETRRDLLGHDSKGVALRMSELRGQVVLLAFWASWCVPCRLELPEVNRVARMYDSRDVTVVAINMGEDLRMTRPFVDEILEQKGDRLAMKLTSDPHSRVASSFGVSSLPTTMLFDRRGVLRAEHSGYDAGIAKRLIGQVAALLMENGKSGPGNRERVPGKPESGVGDLLQGVDWGEGAAGPGPVGWALAHRARSSELTAWQAPPHQLAPAHAEKDSSDDISASRTEAGDLRRSMDT